MKIKFLILFFLLSGNLFASSFFPGNGPKLPKGMQSTVTRKDFYSLIDKLQQLYKKDAKERGKHLSISGTWSINVVNAYAVELYPGIMTVRVLGGIAKHPLMTKDGLAMVVCHEVGHHMGGAPKKWERMNKWAADEAQADYFAPLQCLKRLWANDNNEEINAARAEQDPQAFSLCAQTHKGKELALCVRSLYAAADVAKLVATVTHADTMPRYDTPDPTVVDTTNQEHPGAQCRLDTMVAGALCGKNPEKFDDVDPNKGVCNVLEGDIIGNRPLCWYFPAN